MNVTTIAAASGVTIPPWPSPSARRLWRGAILIPDALPGQPDHGPFGPLGDQRRIWTSAYTCYDQTWRKKIREEFKKRGYTHFTYDCAGWIYHDHYGYVPDDARRVRRDLSELLTDGLIPVVAACNDADGGSVEPWPSFVSNADLIPIAFPMWEQNGPLGVPERQPDGSYVGRGMDVIANTRKAAPKADLYLHFTAGHGAPGYPEERASWRYVRDHWNVLGLLSQDEGYLRNPVTADPEGTAAGLQDTAERLGQEGLLNVAFEQITFPTYNHEPGYDEAFQRRYGAYLMQHAPKTAGYCDGGVA